MFWRFAFPRKSSPVRQVLLVNRAEVVGSICDCCGDELVHDPAGEPILVASPDASDGHSYHYCRRCEEQLWVPTMAGRNMKSYSRDWAMPLRSSETIRMSRSRFLMRKSDIEVS
jgi:hypothetical protein